MNRLWAALAIYGLLAGLAWQTLSDERIRLVALVILGGITVKTLLHWRQQQAAGKSHSP